MLYFSIFPEDHIIEKDNLIRRWIGEGFIHKQAGVRTLHESAELCFNELINRSLIQPSEIDWEEFGGSSEVKSCRVHDTVLDFIVSKAVEENFVTVIDAPGFVNPDPLNKVRRLSLQNMGEIPPDLDVSHSRSLHVFGRNAKIPSLSEFRLLRVLDFDECGQLKDDGLAGIGNLLHLKYLRFRHAHSRHSVTKLPEELARLQHLEIDIMQDCEKGEVMMIPEIVQKQLVCYVTVIAEEYTALKDEIAGIQGLRVLENVDVELGIHFQKKYIVGDNWVEKQEKAVLSVWKLGHASLESLYIHVDKADPDPIMEEDWFPCPPCGIRKLSIQGESLTAVPKWMKSLVKLENLSLVLSGIGKEGMEILGSLPSLSYLSIDWWDWEEEEEEEEEKEEKEEKEKGSEMEPAIRRAMEAHPNRINNQAKATVKSQDKSRHPTELLVASTDWYRYNISISKTQIRIAYNILYLKC
uniref:Uncharacterized protein n=1 Tax=Avena sativa TaxID=4498 RepID=A0ACD5ZTN1_AVESA